LGLGRGLLRLCRVSVGNGLRLCGRIWLGCRLFRLPCTGLYFWLRFYWLRFYWLGYYWLGFFWLGFFWVGFFWLGLYV